MVKKVIPTKHNSLVQSFQEDLQENGFNGVNPNQTSSPSDAQIGYCAKLGEVEMQSQRQEEFTGEPYHLHLLIGQLQEIIREKRAILDSIGYYKPVKMGFTGAVQQHQ